MVSPMGMLVTELPVPAREAALFLDIDGTLLDIAPVPQAVVVPAPLIETLARLERGLGGAIAFVSGRAVDEIDRLFAPLVLPAAGEHGAEIRIGNEELALADCSESLAKIRAAAERFAGTRPGVLVEPKQHCIAVHFRLSPERAHEIRRFLAATIAPLPDRFELLPGKMVWEVRPRGVSKGTAIETMLARAPFAGRHPVFAGDDRTDEDGFAAVRRRGGTAIRVGNRVATMDAHHLASPQEFRTWLARLADAVTTAPAGAPG
jgi:trehalose 6-phosphate phosphatase